MATLSHAIAPPGLGLHRRTSHGFSPPSLRLLTTSSGVAKNSSRVFAQSKSHGRQQIDFSDPDWKSKFQKDFEKRFNIPHITDVFPDAVPIPSTFCLQMRTPVIEDFAGGYPSDEEWHGYINNNDRVLLKTIYYSSHTSAGAECIDPNCTWVEQWVHRAGPREKIYFKPEEVKAAIVTCGGLCPGLNDVIRQIVITLEIYGVKQIVGIPYGYRGFSENELAELPLSRKVVQNVHLSGGSLLGVSRGGPSVCDIVDSLEERGINMVFILGGNGTHAGADAIHNECRKRQLRVAVVGVPKTIDNDILLMDKTFGFDTAVEEAQRAINSAYIEAHSAYHGVGIVKLMGRSSGFIAMHASLASGQIDICLIPEVPFQIHGPHGILHHLKYLIQTKGSAVVCVAEGAGQNLIEKTNATDASGNMVFGDIGVHIQQETKKYFKEAGVPVDVKYIDPTYMIRACRANASDGILCAVLGQNAVHGAFAGYSGITVGTCNTHYVYLPIPENLIEKTNATDASGNMVFGDIGVHIQQETKKYFKEAGVPVDVKYIDPTYMIRACRANASDGILCAVLGQNAVHGAFAGYSGITVGTCNTHYVYLPIPEVISHPRLVDPNSRMWHRCLTSTGQPDFI